MEQRVKKCTNPTDLGELKLEERRCPVCKGKFKTLPGSQQIYDNILCLVEDEVSEERKKDRRRGKKEWRQPVKISWGWSGET